jgi:hypothetical protein
MNKLVYIPERKRTGGHQAAGSGQKEACESGGGEASAQQHGVAARAPQVCMYASMYMCVRVFRGSWHMHSCVHVCSVTHTRHMLLPRWGRVHVHLCAHTHAVLCINVLKRRKCSSLYDWAVRCVYCATDCAPD